MPKQSPQQIAAKWALKLTGSGEAYKAGVMAVQENPAQLAIQAKDRWLSGVQEAAQEGRFEAGLADVTKAGWQQACVEKGAANIAAGARLGQAKVARAEAIIGPQRDAIVASLPPRGNLEQNIARAAAMARGMAATRNRRS